MSLNRSLAPCGRRALGAAALAAALAWTHLAPAGAVSKEETARRCVAALQANPEDAAAREQLRRAFTEEYPTVLPAEAPAHLPISHQVCEDAFTAGAAPRRAFYTVGLAFPDAAHRKDPAGHAVSRVLHGYAQEGGGEWNLRFRVLYNRADDSAEALAPRVMRALLAVRAAHLSMLGETSPALSRPLDVWLRADGDGGAEQSGSNLYLLGTEKPREPVELLRQVAHEFGHLALPAIGLLTSPEEWGNGFLGEVLYLRWLSRAPAAKDPVAPPEALGAYVRHEVDPLARAFAAAGWSGLAGQEKSTGGLRLLLGMVLNLEDTRGADAVSQLLRSVRGGTLRDWIAAAPAE